MFWKDLWFCLFIWKNPWNITGSLLVWEALLKSIFRLVFLSFHNLFGCFHWKIQSGILTFESCRDMQRIEYCHLTGHTHLSLIVVTLLIMDWHFRLIRFKQIPLLKCHVTLFYTVYACHLNWLQRYFFCPWKHTNLFLENFKLRISKMSYFFLFKTEKPKLFYLCCKNLTYCFLQF